MKYPNTGILFANRVKKNPKAPDYTGDVELDLGALGLGGGEHKLRIAGWKRTSAKGVTFLSLKLELPREQEERPQESRVDESLNDEIPF